MRIILNHCFALGVIFFMILNSTRAQNGDYIVVRDLESWTSAEVKYKVNKKWKLGLEGQLRMDKNSLEIKSFFNEFSASRKINKHFDLTGGLRYTNKFDNAGNVQGNDHYLRYFLDVEFDHKLNRFTFKYRLRYTKRDEIGITKAEGDTPIHYFRFKPSVEYNIKNWKLDPKVSAEIYNRYKNGSSKNGFDNIRLTAGTSYKIKKFGTVGLAYRMERELTSYYPKTTNIILLSYSYQFKKKRK